MRHVARPHRTSTPLYHGIITNHPPGNDAGKEGSPMKTITGRRRSEIIAPLAYLAVWVLVLIVFWCFTDGAGAMGFTLVFLWGVLPLATVIVSLAIGLCDSFGRWK